MDSTTETTVPFGTKLGRLIKLMARHPDGRTMTIAEWRTDFIAKTGVGVSAGYISDLLHDKVAAPRIDLVAALTSYFKVDAAYFIAGPDDLANQAKLDLLEAMRSNAVSGLAIRAAGLSEPTLRKLAQVIESARMLEELPPTPGTDL